MMTVILMGCKEIDYCVFLAYFEVTNDLRNTDCMERYVYGSEARENGKQTVGLHVGTKGPETCSIMLTRAYRIRRGRYLTGSYYADLLVAVANRGTFQWGLHQCMIPLYGGERLCLGGICGVESS